MAPYIKLLSGVVKCDNNSLVERFLPTPEVRDSNPISDLSVILNVAGLIIDKT